jgi:glucose/arabinose dehydrogenase
VGQNRWEEVNFQAADSDGGENYGWNIYEGAHAFSGAAGPEDLVYPIAEYSHRDGCSVTGGYVYRGDVMPDFQGVYLYGDYCSGLIWAVYRDEAGAWQNLLFMRTDYTISSFGEDEQGELYLTDHNGRVLRLEAAR